jgi:uncharacterized protein with PIN domain
MENKKMSAIQMALIQGFQEQIKFCPNCNSKREDVKYENLPEKVKVDFAEDLKMDDYKNGAVFLYCKKCNAYFIQSKCFSSF